MGDVAHFEVTQVRPEADTSTALDSATRGSELIDNPRSERQGTPTVPFAGTSRVVRSPAHGAAMKRSLCRLLGVLVAAGSLLTLTACGGGAAVRDMRFPSSEALGALLAAPTDPGSMEPGVVVDSWTFAQLRERFGFEVVRPEVPIDDVGAVAPADAPHTAGMACAATELARVYAAHGDLPSHALTGVIGSRCGVSGHLLGSYYVQAEGSLDNYDLTSNLDIAREVLTDAEAWGVGAWVEGDVTTIAFVAGQMDVQIDPAPFGGFGDTVEISGMALGNVERAVAVITQGATGAAECERDLSVAWPSWRFACPALADDDIAEIELLTFEPDRLLSSGGARFSVSPSGAAPDTWELRSIELAGDGPFDAALVENINRWREAVGLGPLRFEAAQSEVVSRATPAFMSSETPEQARDTITLGLMAGWQVSRPRASASLSSARVAADSPERAGAELVARPWSRYTLLDPEADAVAVGVEQVGELAGTCVVTYRDFQAADSDAIADALLVRLAAERSARGNDTTRRMSDSQRRALDTAADRVADSGRRPDRQIRGALQRVANGVPDPVYSNLWTFAYDPEEITFPEQILNAEIVSAAISVAPYQPEGSAWTSWTVMLLYRMPAR